MKDLLKMRLLAQDDGAGGGGGGSAGTLTGGDPEPGSLTGNDNPPPASTGTFKDQLTTEQRNLSSLKDINTVADLVTSFDHAQSMIGKTRLEMPTEEADAKDWDNFYESTGRPKEPKDYQFWEGDEPEFPEGVERDEKMEDFFRQKMHERGLSSKQARGIYEDFMEFTGMSAKAGAEKFQENLKLWDKEARDYFGLAYNEKIAGAQRVIQNIGMPEFEKLLDQTGMSSHPASLQAFAKLAEMMGEHVGTPGGGNRTVHAKTPEQARNEIVQLQANGEFMKTYNNADSVGHTDAMKKMANLFSAAYPETEG